MVRVKDFNKASGYTSYIVANLTRSSYFHLRRLRDVGQAPRYLRDLIRLPSSAISLCPLCSLDRNDLFFLRARTSMAQTEPLQSMALRFGTNSFLLRDPLY